MMDNRRNLRDYSVCLLTLIALDIFTAFGTLVNGYFDGTFERAFANVDPSLATAAKVVMGVILALEVALIVAQILIGLKGIKISKNPTADKGYITAAKVFFVFSIIAAISYVISMFSITAETAFNTIVSLLSTLCNVACYAFCIKFANAVRQDALK